MGFSIKKLEQELHEKHKRSGLCPTPGKHAWIHKEQAEKILRGITNKRAHNKNLYATRPTAPTRVYKCECGMYHLTPRSVEEYENLRQKYTGQ